MIRFLLRLAIHLVTVAVALLIAQWLVTGVELHLTGFFIAVGVFTVAQMILGPFVFNLARQYASAVLGGIGIVSTLVALWVASLFPNGLEITGLSSWILAALVVWIVTALGGWLLGLLILDKWWTKRQEAKSAA